MMILSDWAYRTARGEWSSDDHNLRERHRANSRVERHLRVFDMFDIGGGAVHIRGRETIDLRPIRGAPPIGRGYARYQPLP